MVIPASTPLPISINSSLPPALRPHATQKENQSTVNGEQYWNWNAFHRHVYSSSASNSEYSSLSIFVWCCRGWDVIWVWPVCSGLMNSILKEFKFMLRHSFWAKNEWKIESKMEIRMRYCLKRSKDEIIHSIFHCLLWSAWGEIGYSRSLSVFISAQRTRTVERSNPLPEYTWIWLVNVDCSPVKDIFACN